MQVTRRSLLGTAAGVTAIAGVGLSGCGIFTQNADGSYGLSAAVINAISAAVQAVAKYAPAVESIAATAASLFGSGYAAIVTLGSTALNQVISYLENLVASPPTLGGARAAVYARFGLPTPSGTLVGYTKNGVPVFAQ